jgi:hypothetical protein
MNSSQRGRLRSGLGAPQEIAFGDDADEASRGVDHRQAADPVLQHQAHAPENRIIGGDRDHVAGHHVCGFHGETPLVRDHPKDMRALVN